MLPEDQPCQKACHRIEHGEDISAGLTKRSVSDAELCAYLNSVCELCGSSRDSSGRSALHLAAACGRTDVCRWLICQKGCRVDEKDAESGYTALHRSVFYGKIDTAVALIKLGANPNTPDLNDLTPLDHAMKDNPLPSPDRAAAPTLIYMWGSNSNYTLGAQRSRNTPEIFDEFHRRHPNTVVKAVRLEKFHCVILGHDGQCFSYGMGQGGRLGLGSDSAVLEPTRIKFAHDVEIADVSTARDHCLFLTTSNEVWSCGLNTHKVLGLDPPPAQLLSPKHISYSFKANSLRGVSCGKYHSVAWGSQAVYTWGLHAGQLGHESSSETHIVLPKAVTSVAGDWKIIGAVASNGATAVATSRGDVYVLHEFLCRKIASRQLDIVSINMIGGRLNKKSDDGKVELRVVALTKAGNALVWKESDPQLCRCIFSLNRLLIVKQVVLNVDGPVFLTADREIFKGKFLPRRKKPQNHDKDAKAKSSFHRFLEKNDCTTVEMEKVAKIHSSETIECDQEGQNFAAIHLNTMSYLTRIPEISATTIAEEFGELLQNPDQSDIAFIAGGETFTAHKYIVSASSDKLAKMIRDVECVKLDKVHPKIFEQILKYIYTGRCDLLHEGCCKLDVTGTKTVTIDTGIEVEEEQRQKSAFEVYGSKQKRTSVQIDPLRMLQEAAKKLGIDSLHKLVNNYSYSNGYIKCKFDQSAMPKMLMHDYEAFPELYDVAMESKHGKVVEAHKCVLAARSEFFGNMFSMRWTGSTTKTRLSLPFTQTALKHLMTYVYTDQLDLEGDDIESASNLLVMAEYLQIPRLLEICEFALSRLITFKNVWRVISIAHFHNADQLKSCCMEYICLNLSATLEGRYLEQLDDDLLAELTQFYSEWNRSMCTRVVTPYSDAVSDDIVKEINAKSPVKMNFEKVVKVAKVASNTVQRKSKHRSQKISLSDKVENETSPEKEQTDVVSEVANRHAVAMPPRLQAINSAMEKLEMRKQDDFEFVKLNQAEEFPGLGAYSKSPGKQEKIEWHKITKVSQKERKRLSSENAAKEPVPESPKNPWKILEATSPVGSPDIKLNMSSIITQEKKQKENLNKLKSKMLVHTQMEDKALEELRKFYNVDNVFDEVIVVERVAWGAVAVPVWVQK